MPNDPTSSQLDDENHLANPEPQNKFVGVDEEGLYLTNVPKSGVF
jgi:hypothetical protein